MEENEEQSSAKKQKMFFRLISEIFRKNKPRKSVNLKSPKFAIKTEKFSRQKTQKVKIR